MPWNEQQKAAEKMKIRLERGISLDGLNAAERLDVENLLDKEVTKREVNADITAARVGGVV